MQGRSKKSLWKQTAQCSCAFCVSPQKYQLCNRLQNLRAINELWNLGSNDIPPLLSYSKLSRPYYISFEPKQFQSCQQSWTAQKNLQTLLSTEIIWNTISQLSQQNKAKTSVHKLHKVLFKHLLYEQHMLNSLAIHIVVSACRKAGRVVVDEIEVIHYWWNHTTTQAYNTLCTTLYVLQ